MRRAYSAFAGTHWVSPCLMRRGSARGGTAHTAEPVAPTGARSDHAAAGTGSMYSLFSLVRSGSTDQLQGELKGMWGCRLS